mmetsp:Transcript_62770/g.124086  ORF Transcript_62770/g.124086 Transcript_62770/m.124086 type:complete len:838 (-) Transcript_62770:134-2647(-)
MGQCQQSSDCTFLTEEQSTNFLEEGHDTKAKTLIQAQPAIRPRQRGSPVDVPVRDAESYDRAAAACLRSYFCTGYLDGKLYEGPNYHRHYDEELEAAMLVHSRSGICVWNEALDLRAFAPKSSSEVLFHYTARDVFRAAVRSDPDLAALIKLLTMDVCSDFGPGFITNASEPDTFGYKDDVLLNNHWPRVADPAISDQEHETWLLTSGDSAAGPGDSQNWRVVEAILENPKNQGKADFCIPLIVPHCFVRDLWNQWPLQRGKTTVVTTMEAERKLHTKADVVDVDEVAAVGCNRWGDMQWKGRDICMVHLNVEGNSMRAKAARETRLEVFFKRMSHLEGLIGRTHPETVAFVTYFAVVLHKLGRYKKAVELFRQVVDCRFAVLGESHSKTLAALRCLGRSLKEAGRLGEAEEVFRRILQTCKKRLGPDDPAVVVALSDLAAIVQASGKHDLAVVLLEEALRRRESMLDSWPQDWEMMVLKQSLAKLLQGQGKYEQAEVLLRDVLDFAAHSAANPVDIVMLQPHLDLVNLLKAMGESSRDEGIHRQTVALCEANLGRNHHETLGCLEELAIVLQAMSQQDEAEELLRRVVDGREQTQGEDHPDTIAALDNLAMCLKAHGKHSAAVPLLRSVLDRNERALGPEHPSTLAAIVELAMVLPAAGKNGELELLLRRALEVWQLQGKPALKARTAEPSHAMMVVAAALDGARYAAASLESWRKAGIEEQDLSKVIEAHLDVEAVREEERASTQADGTLSHSETGGIEDRCLSKVAEAHLDTEHVAGEQESATPCMDGTSSPSEPGKDEQDLSTVIEAHLDVEAFAGEHDKTIFQVDGHVYSEV